MSDFSTRFASKKQDWETPAEIFLPLHAEFHFTLDAAASAQNAKVEKFYDIAADGFASDWGLNRVWLNPPYDGARPLSSWVKRSCAAARAGALVVLLIPARTNTVWFHDYCLKFGEVRFVRGRPKFGNADHGLPLPLCVVIFRPQYPSAEDLF